MVSAWTVLLPLLTVSEANGREHWSTKARRVKLHRTTAKRLTPVVLLPIVVTLTRLGVRELDGDNLQSAFKAIRDGVADRFGITDNDPRITWRYAQVKVKSKDCGVRLDIEAR